MGNVLALQRLWGRGKESPVSSLQDASDLSDCLSFYAVDLPRVPLEPVMLALNAISSLVEAPLALRIAAPRVATAGDVEIEVIQLFSYPHRLVRVAIGLPVEYELFKLL